jgi:uncharacterized membrane protein YqjE
MTAPMRSERSTNGAEPSLGVLLKDLTGELQQLFRAEVELAKRETREEVQRAAGVARFGGVALLAAYLALLLLSFAAAWGLAEVMPAGLAFLIVGIVFAVVAGGAAMVARERMRSVRLVPDETVETLKEDVAWARARSK